MAVTRPPLPADHYAVIDNRWLRDPHLSWGAKGLLAYLSTHAVGYRLTTEQILAEAIDGRCALQAVMRELIKTGYLKRAQTRDERGRHTGFDYEICDPRAENRTPAPTSASAGQTADRFSGRGESATKKNTPKKISSKKNTPQPSVAGAAEADAPTEPLFSMPDLEVQEPTPATQPASGTTSAVVTTRDSAQSILRDLIDWHRRTFDSPPVLVGHIKVRLGGEIRKLLDEGVPADLIKKALAAMTEVGKIGRPSLLPSFVTEVTNSPQRATVHERPQVSPYAERAAGFLDLANQFRNERLAEEASQQMEIPQ